VSFFYYDGGIDETTGLIAGSSGLFSSDPYVHMYNWGPGDLIANMTETASPAAPTNIGIPVKAGEWTLLPADEQGGPQRIAFALATEGDHDAGMPALSVWSV
jgi:hypothetical protein